MADEDAAAAVASVRPIDAASSPASAAVSVGVDDDDWATIACTVGGAGLQADSSSLSVQW
jgi:hypothetical protein